MEMWMEICLFVNTVLLNHANFQKEQALRDVYDFL